MNIEQYLEHMRNNSFILGTQDNNPNYFTRPYVLNSLDTVIARFPSVTLHNEERVACLTSPIDVEILIHNFLVNNNIGNNPNFTASIIRTKQELNLAYEELKRKARDIYPSPNYVVYILHLQFILDEKDGKKITYIFNQAYKIRLTKTFVILMGEMYLEGFSQDGDYNWLYPCTHVKLHTLTTNGGIHYSLRDINDEGFDYEKSRPVLLSHLRFLNTLNEKGMIPTCEFERLSDDIHRVLSMPKEIK